MKKYSMEEEKARRMAIKELTRVSEKIGNKKQSMLRLKQQIQKLDGELVKLNQVLEQHLSVIHRIVMPKIQTPQATNKEGRS